MTDAQFLVARILDMQARMLLDPKHMDIGNLVYYVPDRDYEKLEQYFRATAAWRLEGEALSSGFVKMKIGALEIRKASTR